MLNSFTHLRYGLNGTYTWLYSNFNARKILKCSPFLVDLYTVLSFEMFYDKLFLHNENSKLVTKNTIFKVKDSSFIKSKLLQKEYFTTLKSADWTFQDVVLSAFYYFLKKAIIFDKKTDIRVYCS